MLIDQVKNSIDLPTSDLEFVITKSGLYNLISVGLEPFIVEIVNSIDIPDVSFDISLGIAEGSFELNDIDIESFTFFDDNQTYISFLAGKDVSVTLDGGGFVISADYCIKLLTYPYSQYSGGITLTLEDVSVFATFSVDIKADSTDQSCGDNSCGYDDIPQLDTLKLSIGFFQIVFVGDVNPLIQSLTYVLESTLVPWFTSLLSQQFTIAVNEQLDHSGGASHYTHWPDITYFVMSGSPGFVISDSYITAPYYSGYSIRVDDSFDDSNLNLDPLMANYDPGWYPTFPEVLTNTDFTYFLSPILIHSAWFTQAVTNRSYWNSSGGFTGTKYKLSCVEGRYGCTADTEGLSSLSPFFEADTYESMQIPELLLCDGCDIEVDWLFVDPDYDPVLPDLPTIFCDGFSMTYTDLFIRIRGVDSNGTDVFSKEFLTTVTFKGLVISDHAFLNIVQGFEGFDSIVYSSKQKSSINSIFSTSSPYSSDNDLSKWEVILNIASTLYLAPFLSNYFNGGWSWFTSIAVGYMNMCLTKEEEVYYSVQDGYIAVSSNVAECECNRSMWEDDTARYDNGMLFCVH
ncbi:hypothetical protein ADUPG1_010084 [Aduncisulcus paluster]|uniref:Uncharacterized protein n=1 Tax=Aduncisulcus paluster TaxID=2918883 RepID=A0ABQ5KXT7_9EUKA|nr:hypothetical protein ADUPG1_010084 [Aduncisulcus paluster]